MDMKKFLIDLERLVNIDCGSNVPKGVQEVNCYIKSSTGFSLKVYEIHSKLNRLAGSLFSRSE